MTERCLKKMRIGILAKMGDVSIFPEPTVRKIDASPVLLNVTYYDIFR